MNGGAINRQGLTLKQARFVHYYIKTGGNGYKAAKFAGYNGRMNVLAAIASENLTKPKVASELKRRMSKVLTSNEVLEKLSDVADSQVEKVTTADKLKALELVGKFHKLFTDRTETVDLTAQESHRAYIANEVQRLRLAHSDDDEAYHAAIAQLRAQFIDASDPTYDPLLDYTKHPENWPPVESQQVVADSGSDNN